jgi:hypothetical protein
MLFSHINLFDMMSACAAIVYLSEDCDIRAKRIKE